jgi:phage shock protein A
LGRLEAAVDAALSQVQTLRKQVRTAESRSSELETLLERYSSGDEKPGEAAERVRALEQENGELRSRLEQGREGVERLLARIRFLEEQR